MHQIFHPVHKQHAQIELTDSRGKTFFSFHVFYSVIQYLCVKIDNASKMLNSFFRGSCYLDLNLQFSNAIFVIIIALLQEEIDMRADLNNTIALIIDEQEKLMPVINEAASVLRSTKILVEGLKILDVPFLITQQYTKGMGMTVPPLLEAAGTDKYYDKRTFSCWDDEAIRQAIESSGKKQVLLAGVEAHICLLQTAVDLLDAGYDVFVVENCVSSRKPNDKAVAIRRMMQSGVQVTTYESILFELMRTSTHPNFKEISKLIK